MLNLSGINPPYPTPAPFDGLTFNFASSPEDYFLSSDKKSIYYSPVVAVLEKEINFDAKIQTPTTAPSLKKKFLPMILPTTPKNFFTVRLHKIFRAREFEMTFF